MRYRLLAIAATATIGAAALVGAAPAGAANDQHGGHPAVRHVLLLSVDGLHQQDLTWWVQHHPTSALAGLAGRGVEFSRAQTTFPSDSFPGMVAQVTGGTPKTTGVYYDDTYNHALLPAGTTTCAGVKPGVEVTYFEQLDKNQNALDAGQGLAGLPGSILSMTGSPEQVIDPTQLPVDPKTCQPVYPHQYLKVNTVFEVARAHNLVTAWSDKHPAYDVLQGPSGQGIQDLFTPEINSQADATGDDWTTVNSLTQQYDGYKVQAVLNEIDGYDHSRSVKLGTPAIFGMNFQTVSTAQKLPTSDGKTGGYLADGVTPGPLLQAALSYVDTQVGRFVHELSARGLANQTAVIISAKHGQSPTVPAQLTRIPDGPIIDALDAAWKAAGHTADLVAFAVDDDAMLMWLSDRSQPAADFAANFLVNHSGTGNDITGAARAYTASGLSKVYPGAAAAAFIGTPVGDARVPDLIGIAQQGVVYTGKKGKIAEHGGDAPADRDVPILVAAPGTSHASTVAVPVLTTQIAPTILALLGLDPRDLAAVRAEHTPVLPGLS
ncbi:MAG TPA: alkaline phosphatase family protein [Rugosimonospora sp.]|nr:alkaline phosphatase family protein [Rugosimonospora sp.]